MTGAVSDLDNLLEELGTWGKDIREDGDMDTTDKKGDLEDQLDDLTEKLKAALETGEPMAKTLGTCFKCGEEIKEKSMLVGDKVYCEGCFVCDSCNTRYVEEKILMKISNTKILEVYSHGIIKLMIRHSVKNAKRRIYLAAEFVARS